MERNVKFSQADTRTGLKNSDNHGEGSVSKTRSKSSTLSLHTVSGHQQHQDEPTLQRRNSIHNVPFVDVNDPDTRTRMERYKEERRSMLRAKYKAEDYLSSSFSRKKRPSTNSSQDSSESDLTPSHDLESNPLEIRTTVSAPSEGCNSNNVTSEPSTNISHNMIIADEPEQSFISTAYLPNKKNEVFYRSEVAVASVQKKSSNPMNLNKKQARPDELTFSESDNILEKNVKNLIMPTNIDLVDPKPRQSMNNSSPDSQEDNVNVRERASIFGPRKFSETRVRTVAAPVSESSNSGVKKHSFSGTVSGQNQTSPSKIKNMAAMFEQRQ